MSDTTDLIAAAINDPGQFVGARRMEQNESLGMRAETLADWQARAVRAVLDMHPEQMLPAVVRDEALPVTGITYMLYGRSSAGQRMRSSSRDGYQHAEDAREGLKWLRAHAGELGQRPPYTATKRWTVELPLGW